jgi:hypothetical protein
VDASGQFSSGEQQSKQWQEKKVPFFYGKVHTVGDLGVTEVADLELRCGAAIQHRVLQLQVLVAVVDAAN